MAKFLKGNAFIFSHFFLLEKIIFILSFERINLFYLLFKMKINRLINLFIKFIIE
jgi:hypothetical protein